MSSRAASKGQADPKLVSQEVNHGRSGEKTWIKYSFMPKPVGNGSFGVVFEAAITEPAPTQRVAIKQVLQDKRFKNRELQIMKIVNHPNVVDLRYYFYANGDRKEEVYLNLILEYIPETVYATCRYYTKYQKGRMPVLEIKIYIYQLFRALAYIHSQGICHRDIKPQNLLVDPDRFVLKLCDFGSAKVLDTNEPNVSYICSRYYRAPELIFGATHYTTMIDIWSTGCVMAEMMSEPSKPIFPGESGIDQLVEIIKVLGTPNREEIRTMNPNYMEHKFPQIKAMLFSKIFSSRHSSESIDLLTKLLTYTPMERLDASQAMAHPYFNELRNPDTKVTNIRKSASEPQDLPELFNFTDHEMSIAPAKLTSEILPENVYRDFHQSHPNFKPLTDKQMAARLD